VPDAVNPTDERPVATFWNFEIRLNCPFFFHAPFVLGSHPFVKDIVDNQKSHQKSTEAEAEAKGVRGNQHHRPPAIATHLSETVRMTS
jgi:hypothetical protein